MKNQYTFDKDFNLRRVTHSVRGMLWTCTKWIITTASLAAFYYILFSFFINTDEEKKLIELIARHHEILSSSLKNVDLDVFEKYADCFTEYASMIECQAFEIGFRLAVKLLMDRE